MIGTGLIIQVFMLRNMKVAATLRAETIEAEAVMRARVDNLTVVYLPLYFVLSTIIYIIEVVVFSNKQQNINLLIGLYIVFNVIKLTFSAFIGITTLKFGASISKLIKLVQYEFGETFPQIPRLKLMRKLIISMSVTYILVDCFYDLLLPIMLVVIVKVHDVDNPDAKTWRESMQLISDIRVQFVLAFNIQMVYFYYKLALPSTGMSRDVIERAGDEQSHLDRSNDPTYEPTAKLSEQSVNSFARFMEGDGLDVQQRE
jgi:hypothetical protein